MVYMNTKSIAYSTLDPMDAATNSSFAGKAMALKMTNGCLLHYYKTVRPSMFGMTLVVTCRMGKINQYMKMYYETHIKDEAEHHISIVQQKFDQVTKQERVVKRLKKPVFVAI